MADEFCIDNDLLISLIEQRPVLWDKTMELYKNRVATEAAWKEIIIVLDPDFETRKEEIRRAYVKMVIQRWTHIRDNYQRSYKKIQNQRRSGAKKSKPYVYSKQLSFLQKIFRPFEIASHVKTENQDEDSDNQENKSNANDEWEINFIDTNDLAINPTLKLMPERRMESGEKNLEAKIIKFMDTYTNSETNVTNRHLSFFNGILPTLNDFDDNEVLEFQMGVLQLLKKIKSSRQNHELVNF